MTPNESLVDIKLAKPKIMWEYFQNLDSKQSLEDWEEMD